MTSNKEELNKEISTEELEAMDEALTQIETIYKSRCVRIPGANNVVVKEIPSKKDPQE